MEHVVQPFSFVSEDEVLKVVNYTIKQQNSCGKGIVSKTLAISFSCGKITIKYLY